MKKIDEIVMADNKASVIPVYKELDGDKQI